MTTPSTLAEKWLDIFNRSALSSASNAERLLKLTFNANGGLAIGPVVKNGEQVGARYLFNDSSFVDFYFEEPGKAYPGINGGKDIRT
jgi:hypothetical protein